MEKYQVTGNEYLSLPTIRETDGAAEGITFLHMGAKGMLELRGDDAVLIPTLRVNDRDMQPALLWNRRHYWIPECTGVAGGVRLTCTYLTPLDERGFGIRLQLCNEGIEPATVSFGLHGSWGQTLHEINETKELQGERRVLQSGWNHAFVWEHFMGLPLFAFAPCFENAEYHTEGLRYAIQRTQSLQPQAHATLDIFFGLGYEEVAAATSAKELMRQGFDALLTRTEEWLAAREKYIQDEKLCTLLNTNMFFTFFYASGKSLDTEEHCLMTSRSPRYYVSAAYWDRDSLLWSFPAILMTDTGFAKEILHYVFTKQIRNVGIHSRYIDGTVLEPGFELDELCAPVIALDRYLAATGDSSFAQMVFVQEGLRHILHRLETKRHPTIALYETFLQPTDDMHVYRYLTYDNVLVWRTLHILAALLDMPILNMHADAVRAAIAQYCVQQQSGRPCYCWSTDLNGHFDVYDEPPGSLQLLPFYGFCDPTDELWQNTIAMIRNTNYRFSFAGSPIAEIGCEHAPHPWILSICNSLLCGYRESALLHLTRTSMDNGLACESVDEETGECTTGEAFATCAGFLAYALWESRKNDLGV